MTPAPIKPEISIDTLAAIDVRAGTIDSVHDVAGSSKLVRLVVDFGDHRRNILAGLKKERPDPRSLAGRQALFVVNLPPRKMADEVSEGMLFDIGYADGIVPALAVPEVAVPNGARAG
jgi:tRNA-binding protein